MDDGNVLDVPQKPTRWRDRQGIYAGPRAPNGSVGGAEKAQGRHTLCGCEMDRTAIRSHHQARAREEGTEGTEPDHSGEGEGTDRGRACPDDCFDFGAIGGGSGQDDARRIGCMDPVDHGRPTVRRPPLDRGAGNGVKDHEFLNGILTTGVRSFHSPTPLPLM